MKKLFYSTEMNSNRNSGAFVLSALAASEDISRILEKNPIGNVHSVFNTSFNLAFGEHLVHIGAVENGLAPFGIGMEQANAQLLTKLVGIDQKVFWDQRSMSLVFPRGISLSLGQVKWTNHKLQPFNYQYAYLKDNFEVIAGRLLQADWQTGLAETEEEKKRIIHYLLDSSSSHEDVLVLEKLEDLKKLASNHEGTEAEKVFNYWIGRGLGLTPSGDDVITGICAVLTALEGTNQTFLQELNAYLLAHGRKRTTHIALEYLHYATDNKFHTHLLEICTVLDKPQGPEFLKALEEMKKMGHTSGADTLVGILVGIKASIFFKKSKKG